MFKKRCRSLGQWVISQLLHKFCIPQLEELEYILFTTTTFKTEHRITLIPKVYDWRICVFIELSVRLSDWLERRITLGVLKSFQINFFILQMFTFIYSPLLRKRYISFYVDLAMSIWLVGRRYISRREYYCTNNLYKLLENRLYCPLLYVPHKIAAKGR